MGIEIPTGDVILVYKCDNWHSHDSKELIGVAEDIGTASRMCSEYAAHHKIKKLTEEDYEQMVQMGQTQGYEGPGEFYTELWTLNTPVL